MYITYIHVTGADENFMKIELHAAPRAIYIKIDDKYVSQFILWNECLLKICVYR